MRLEDYISAIKEAEDRWPKGSGEEYLKHIEKLMDYIFSTKRGQEMFYKWMCKEYAAYLFNRSERVMETRLAALHFMVSHRGFLFQGLSMVGSRWDHKRPNLISFLRAKLVWRASGIQESDFSRHERRMRLSPDPHALLPVEDRSLPGARASEEHTLVRQIIETFGPENPAFITIFNGIMADLSVAELARQTGLSRQQIYRLFERIRNES